MLTNAQLTALLRRIASETHTPFPVLAADAAAAGGGGGDGLDSGSGAGTGGFDSGGTSAGIGGDGGSSSSGFGGDSMTPLYLTISPTGQVGAAFTGTISAQGITFPPATGLPPPAPNSIEWIDTGGALVARIGAAEESGVDTWLEIDSIATPSEVSSGITLSAINGGGSTEAVLQIRQSPSGSPSAVTVSAGGRGALTIMDANGDSSYLMNANGAPGGWMGFFGAEQFTWGGGGDALLTFNIGVFTDFVGAATFVNESGLTEGFAYAQSVNPSAGTIEVVAIPLNGTPPAGRVDAVWLFGMYII